jgi:hypothetical protein
LENKIVTLSRKELYAQVWAEPMTRLAARYGFSDVGLAKICKKYKIPRPPRGYWTQKQFGNAPRRPSLPNPGNNPDIQINTHPAQISRPGYKNPLQGLIAHERKSENKIVVPKELENLHPLIFKTFEILNSLKPERTGKIKPPWGQCLDIEVTRCDLPRALLIMDTLIKAMENRGFEIPPITGQTIIKIGDAHLGIELQGHSIQTRCEPKDHNLNGYYHFGYNLLTTRPDLPGHLRLSIISGYGNGLDRRSWGDSPSKRLEDLLNDVIIGLLKAAGSNKNFEDGTINQNENGNEFQDPEKETGGDL